MSRQGARPRFLAVRTACCQTSSTLLRTKVVTHVLFHTTEERDGMMQSGMEQGLEQSYAALDRLLGQGKG
jgi:uncharacterized protein YndB with AHSA1/START domain